MESNSRWTSSHRIIPFVAQKVTKIKNRSSQIISSVQVHSDRSLQSMIKYMLVSHFINLSACTVWCHHFLRCHLPFAADAVAIVFFCVISRCEHWTIINRISSHKNLSSAITIFAESVLFGRSIFCVVIDALMQARHITFGIVTFNDGASHLLRPEKFATKIKRDNQLLSSPTFHARLQVYIATQRYIFGDTIQKQNFEKIDNWPGLRGSGGTIQDIDTCCNSYLVISIFASIFNYNSKKGTQNRWRIKVPKLRIDFCLGSKSTSFSTANTMTGTQTIERWTVGVRGLASVTVNANYGSINSNIFMFGVGGLCTERRKTFWVRILSNLKRWRRARDDNENRYYYLNGKIYWHLAMYLLHSTYISRLEPFECLSLQLLLTYSCDDRLGLLTDAIRLLSLLPRCCTFDMYLDIVLCLFPGMLCRKTEYPKSEIILFGA